MFLTYVLILEKFKPNEFQIGNKLSEVTLFKFELERIIGNTRLFNTTIDDIQPYGSRISGLFTDDSDVDFNISYSKYYILLILLFILNC